MVSIFSYVDSSKFWMKYSPAYDSCLSQTLYFGTLKRQKSGQWVKHIYQLTSTALIEMDDKGNPYKLAYPHWKLLDPFYEETSDGPNFGFRLGRKDFYAESSESLDRWIECLKKICIASTFEEDFAIIKEIGKGSSSTVYLVEDLETRKQHAAKCVNKSLLREKKSSFRNLIQEIKVLYELDHPNIVDLYYVYETSDCIYMIMEYFPQGDLYKRILQKKYFSEEDCVKFASALLDALDYMHSRHIVHRDLKLENIMMTGENDYGFKIIDFGLSYEGFEMQTERCGSPGYIAPEMLRKCKYNHRVDIFSAGVIMYIIVTGQHPFNASSASKILSKNMKCKVKDHFMLKDRAKEFVMNLLQPLPQNRPDAMCFLDHPWISNLKKLSVCNVIATFSTRVSSVVIE
jgi:serine/threonine protein kinase